MSLKWVSLFDNPDYSIEGGAFLRWNNAIIAVENPTNDFSVNCLVLNSLSERPARKFRLAWQQFIK